MKLYIVVSSALSAGLYAAQAVHAAFLFGEQYPHLKDYWYLESNNVVVLQEDNLAELADQLEGEGFRLSRFLEPDLDDELTAICVEPGAWKLLSSLRLAA
jgi:hypothetical protein